MWLKPVLIRSRKRDEREQNHYEYSRIIVKILRHMFREFMPENVLTDGGVGAHVNFDLFMTAESSNMSPRRQIIAMEASPYTSKGSHRRKAWSGTHDIN